MKVKLLARKGTNKAGTVLELSDASAEFMIRQGYAEKVGEGAKKNSSEPKNASGSVETVLGTGSGDTVIDIPTVEVVSEDPPKKPAARRGRPKKGE